MHSYVRMILLHGGEFKINTKQTNWTFKNTRYDNITWAEIFQKSYIRERKRPSSLSLSVWKQGREKFGLQVVKRSVMRYRY